MEGRPGSEHRLPERMSDTGMFFYSLWLFAKHESRRSSSKPHAGSIKTEEFVSSRISKS